MVSGGVDLAHQPQTKAFSNPTLSSVSEMQPQCGDQGTAGLEAT